MDIVTTNEIEEVIERAEQTGAPITFTYTKADGSFELRSLVVEENSVRETLAGDRLVIGHDLKRGEPRNFRLDRIVEAVV